MTERMEFRRYGRSYHLRIEDAEGLARSVDLDRAHWVATAAPADTINCDSTLISMLDTDGSGRLTSQEIAAGIRWMLSTLRDVEGVNRQSASLVLDTLNTDAPDGRRIHASATKMLTRLGRVGEGAISLEQVRAIKAQVEAQPVSEAGVVLPEATADPDIRQFLADILAALGGAPHPSGALGVSAAQLDGFLAAVAAYLAWHEQGHTGDRQTAICPLGAETAEACAALEAVRARIDLYFAQCEAAALDERLVKRMGWTDAKLAALDLEDPEAIERALREAPLATPNADRVLRFDADVNPYESERLDRFRRLAAAPVLGETPDALTAAQWRRIKAFFQAHHDWAAAAKGQEVAGLTVERLRAYQDPRFAVAVRELAEASRETAFVMDNIRLTEKLILCQAKFLDLANNFVSFPHLYDPQRRAMFETGELIMDGRRFALAVEAQNHMAHAAVAGTGSMFLMYVQVAPPGELPPYTVAVPVTSGGKGNLGVGKRGVFIDLAGQQHSAQVIHIVDNPISLREAMVAPFKRVGRLFTGKIEALTASAEKRLDTQATSAMDQAAPAALAPQPQSQALAKSGIFIGAGVAIAALGSALTYMVKTVQAMFAGVGPWPIVLTILGAILVVMLPTTILALIKLRRRDLSAILEGSGWAINARMRLTRRQSRFFTRRPDYPSDARGVPRPGLWALIALAVAAAIAVATYTIRQGW